MLQGRLKVYYDFTGNLVELEPKDPSSEFMRMSDADPKTVGFPSRCSGNYEQNIYKYIHMDPQTCVFKSCELILMNIVQQTMMVMINRFRPQQH